MSYVISRYGCSTPSGKPNINPKTARHLDRSPTLDQMECSYTTISTSFNSSVKHEYIKAFGDLTSLCQKLVLPARHMLCKGFESAVRSIAEHQQRTILDKVVTEAESVPETDGHQIAKLVSSFSRAHTVIIPHGTRARVYFVRMTWRL